MKNKKTYLFFTLIVILCVCLTTCSNPVMNEWWTSDQSGPDESDEKEPEYIAIIKMVPQVVYETIYETLVETHYEMVFVQLPSEGIHEYFYPQLSDGVRELIVFIESEPVIIETIITEEHYIYEKISEIFIEYEERDPTEEELIIFIKENPDIIFEYIIQDPELLEIIKEIIIEHYLTDEDIRYIIEQLPPKEIIKYLTDDQIRLIIEQQPPQLIMQSINIISIDYVMFAGNSEVLNGPPGPGGSTQLTTQEINYNTTVIKNAALLLKEKENYLIMFHGHANPTGSEKDEINDLILLSTNRAEAVEVQFKIDYKSAPPAGEDIDQDRISTSGYGGEKVLMGTNSPYASLNRRVEVIIFEITTSQ